MTIVGWFYVAIGVAIALGLLVRVSVEVHGGSNIESLAAYFPLGFIVSLAWPFVACGLLIWLTGRQCHRFIGRFVTQPIEIDAEAIREVDAIAPGD